MRQTGTVINRQEEGHSDRNRWIGTERRGQKDGDENRQRKMERAR